MNKFELEDPLCDFEEDYSTIYCCGCQTNVTARLTYGREIYSHRPDLFDIPFWKCDVCGNYVGCHYKTADRIRPLGVIPTPEIRNARKEIHKILDPIWKSGRMSRSQLYSRLNKELNYVYHTAEIRDLEEARRIWKIVKRIGK